MLAQPWSILRQYTGGQQRDGGSKIRWMCKGRARLGAKIGETKHTAPVNPRIIARPSALALRHLQTFLMCFSLSIDLEHSSCVRYRADVRSPSLILRPLLDLPQTHCAVIVNHKIVDLITVVFHLSSLAHSDLSPQSRLQHLESRPSVRAIHSILTF